MKNDELFSLLNNLLTFLSRVDLKGSEVQAFNQVIAWVQEQGKDLKPPVQEDPKEE